MAEIGHVRNTPVAWPGSAQSIKPSGQQPRQSDKQYKQPQERHDAEDDDDNTHIDEYA